MPLLHISDRQRAAYRANARKSTGPRSAEGKRASAQNGLARRLHSHTYEIPASWRAPLLQRALDKSASVADPIERRLHVHLWLAQAHFDLFFTAWNAMLAECQESNHCTRRRAQALLLTQPGAVQGLSRIYSQGKREVGQAIEALSNYRHLMANPPIPALASLHCHTHDTQLKVQAAPATKPHSVSEPRSVTAPRPSSMMSRHASVGLPNSLGPAIFFPVPNPQLPWNQYPVSNTYAHPLSNPKPSNPFTTPHPASMMSRHASVGVPNTLGPAIFFPESNPQLPWNQYQVFNTYAHPLSNPRPSNPPSPTFFFPEPKPQLPWNQYPVSQTYPHPLSAGPLPQAVHP